MKKKAKNPTHMQASDLLALLAAKHANDVFVPACKNGPTWGTGGHCQLDAWVMRRSYTRPCATGYEIKVSRSDFIADNKWRQYLDYCNQFYFVCPHNMIDPSELPAEAGLLWGSKNLRRLYTKKKAPERAVEIPASLYWYVLISRTAIVKNPTLASEIDNTKYWRSWLIRKKENQQLGYEVSGRIVEVARIAEHRAKQAEENMRAYDTIRERITELGFDPDKGISTWDVNRKLGRLVHNEVDKLIQIVATALDDLKDFQEREIRNGGHRKPRKRRAKDTR